MYASIQAPFSMFHFFNQDLYSLVASERFFCRFPEVTSFSYGLGLPRSVRLGSQARVCGSLPPLRLSAD